MTNGAVVAGDSVDPNPANNTASVTTGVVAAQPASLEVDAHAGGGVGSDVNGVFEPGEQVVVNPSWQNPSGAPAAVTGAASVFGTRFRRGWHVHDRGRGRLVRQHRGRGDRRLPGRRRATATSWPSPFPARARPCTGTPDAPRRCPRAPPGPGPLHLGDSFTDVPQEPLGLPVRRDDSPQRRHLGMRRGHATARSSSLSRAEMAVLLLMAEHGPAYVPPASTGSGLHGRPRSITGRETSSRSSPRKGSPRAAAGARTARTTRSPGRRWPSSCSSPSTARGGFRRLRPARSSATSRPATGPGPTSRRWRPKASPAAAVAGAFCPDSPVSRAEMAVFLTSTFGMRLY